MIFTNVLLSYHPKSQKEMDDESQRLEQILEAENTRHRKHTQQRVSLRRVQSDSSSILNEHRSADTSNAIAEQETEAETNVIVDSSVRATTAPPSRTKPAHANEYIEV